MMKKLIENYSKPTPRKWRKRGDVSMMIVLFLWLAEDFIKDIPDGFLTEAQTLLAIKAIGAIGIMYKAWTNTKFDPTQYTGKV